MTPTDPLDGSVVAATREFDPGCVYLNTATIGLPPRRTVDAVRAALDLWQSGAGGPHDFDPAVQRSRELYAELAGVATSQVAVGSQASVFAGLVAASVPDGAEILVARGEFTSVTFPFLAQAARGVTVREADLDRLVESVGPDTYLVAVSAVQSSNGAIADLDGLADLAANGTQVYLDTTQAMGWLPIRAGRYTWTVASGYKFLLAPRGTCFATISAHPGLQHTSITPHTAGWYAGEDVWTSIYGLPLRLAPDARQYDVSPAWFSWVGQAQSLDLLCTLGPDAIHAHVTELAATFETALGLPVSGSAIISLALSSDATDRLQSAGIACAQRAGRTRLSFHLHNTPDDVATAVHACR